MMSCAGVSVLTVLATVMVLGPGEVCGLDGDVVVAEASVESADGDDVSAGCEPADERLERKRAWARLFGRVWLPILLLLIVFVVLLMVVTRRMRLWVLGRFRQVRFGPTEDVWWNPPGDKAGKTEDSEDDERERDA